MKKFKLILAFTLMLSVLFPSITYANQNNVDYLISVISKGVADKKWKTVEMNIQDMGKLLYQDIEISKLNVKVKSNPIGERLTKVQQRLDEIKAEYKIFNDAYLHYLKARKIKSKEAINDIGVEMINKLSLIGGVSTGGKLTPGFAASNKNAKIIAADLKSIKSLDALGKYIIIKMDSLKPAIREAQAERTELDKLNKKFLAMTKKYIKPVSTKGTFAWVFVETKTNDWETRLAAQNKSTVNSTRVDITASEGSVTLTSTYIGKDNGTWLKPGLAQSGKVTWTAPSLRTIKQGEKFSMALTTDSLRRDHKNHGGIGTILAQVFRLDKDGNQAGSASYLADKNGKSDYGSGAVGNFQSYSATVYGTIGAGSKVGDKMAIRVSASGGGVSVQTSYIYEWKIAP